ncbi:hybrid sensor histidine kinase/response regulator [Eleftheria terrae]|uniref:hybrid sensor histidine kinase/response regulator n=1 Tax=Eleftheria terrae TaxID=1597781 RepID=UPI00263B5CCC|nr:ATP-binding protein [Eleftheria terrae]WKB53693.1 ATP-binding protein [Eleftheria terrae]
MPVTAPQHPAALVTPGDSTHGASSTAPGAGPGSTVHGAAGKPPDTGSAPNDVPSGLLAGTASGPRSSGMPHGDPASPLAAADATPKNTAGGGAAAPGHEAAVEREITERLGLLPNFFRAAGGMPGWLPALWQFAKAAYLDNPLPSLFKERLFVHLSRFCERRYCIVRHVGYLLGRGRPAGDAAACPASVEQVLALLKRAPAGSEQVQTAIAQLAAREAPLAAWPAPDTPLEQQLFDVATALFTDPTRAEDATQALRQALGLLRCERLLACLAYIRAAHAWSLLHPELAYEDDLQALLAGYPALGHLLHGEDVGARSGRMHSESVELQAVRHQRDQLEAVQRELEERDRQKDEFLAMLSHELRNPLAPLRSALELLRLSAPGALDPAPLHEMLERQVNHLVHLVDDLLDVQRITHGKIALRKENVDLLLVVNTAVEASMPHIIDARQRLHLSLLAAPLRVQGDRVRLTQVVTNLLNNAARHTAPGGDIWLTVQREGQQAHISVRDSGHGIEPAMLPHVFDLFAQVPSPGTALSAGLGVGLALVRRLVELHGGSVAAYSEGSGQGSEFTVHLPLATQGLPTLSPAEARSFRLSARVLVVDDNRAAADPVGALLRLIGADAKVCYDGDAALYAIDDGFQPDAVVIDLGMPVMDGFELARLIRQHPHSKDALLIALTGWGHEQHKQMTQAAGFDHHLTKPIDLAALQAALSTIRHAS